MGTDFQAESSSAQPQSSSSGGLLSVPTACRVEPRTASSLWWQGLRAPAIEARRRKHRPERFCPESDITGGKIKYFPSRLYCLPFLRDRHRRNRDLFNTVSMAKCCLDLGTDRFWECAHKSENTCAIYLQFGDFSQFCFLFPFVRKRLISYFEKWAVLWFHPER